MEQPYQALVIGLGQFGMAVARELAAQGAEVLVVDHREVRVRVAATFAAEALTMDATDEEHLAHLSPDRRDLCVCAIGDEAREASILVTAMLRQMGSRRIVARATDDLHERVLRLVGAHEVFNPERIFGERLASRLLRPGVIDVLPLGEDLEITELTAASPIVGRELAELALPRNYNLNVVALRRAGVMLFPGGHTRIEDADVLVVAGPKGASNRFVDWLS